MAVQDSKIARVYARALIDELPPAVWDAALTELRSFVEEYLSNEELNQCLTHPLLFRQEREAAIREIAKLFLTDDRLVNLICLLAENDRLMFVELVAEEFALLVASSKREWCFQVESAFELQQSEQADIEASLRKDFGEGVKVNFCLDRDLIGGLRVSLGDLVYDGSLRGKLTHLKDELLGDL